MSFSDVYQCGVCLKSESVSLVTLTGHERVLALKLVKSFNKYVLLLTAPLRSCKLCYKKLKLLRCPMFCTVYNRIDPQSFTMHYPGFPPLTEEQLFQQQQQEQQELDPSIMQYSYGVPPTTIEQPVQKQYFDIELPSEPTCPEVPQLAPAEPCTDDYNCQCDDCQNKYGSLPILLQGIEQKTFGGISDAEPSTSSQSHTPKRILTCEYCKKTFTHKGDFKKHLRKHTKEKPFSCKVCSKCFGNTSNLLRHQKLHTGEKPFACEFCDKKFSRKDKLDCHKRSRTCQDAGSSSSYQ